MPDEGIDQAARAFDAVVQADVARAPRARPKEPEAGGPEESIFRGLRGGNEVDQDSPPAGGGDDEDLGGTQKGKANSRDTSQRDKRHREGDDDESDGDGSDDAEGSDDESGDDSVQDDDEADDAEDAAGEENEEENKLLAHKVEVTVDGEPQEVTVKEALEGYVRTQTFHRRMNQLDEAKKIVRRAAGDAVQNYEFSMSLAKTMQAHMDEMIPKEPDWDAEFQKDPVKARDMQRYYEKANAFKATLNASMVEANKKMAESSNAQLQAFAEEEGAKFENMNRKNWTDPKKKAKDLDSMRRTALATGFSEDELSQVYDSRMLSVLLKASKYDRMMAAKPKPVVRTNAKPIPPGAGSATARTAQKGVTSAMKRLNRTGSIDDAAVVFDQLVARR